MKQFKRSLLAVTLAGAVALTPVAMAAAPAMTVYAHGQHHNNTSTHYYYCNGHAAHTHSNGVCPYGTSGTSGTDYYHCNGHAAHEHYHDACPYGNASTSTVKKVQRKLNSCGYSCGTADGIIGLKTYKAIRKFQKDNDLKVTGVLKKKTLKALGLA